MTAPLRAHLLLLVIALVIPLAGLLGLGAWRDARNAVAQAQAVHRPLATLVATDVARKLTTVRTALTRLAQRPHVQTMDRTVCSTMLTELQGLSASFHQILLTGPDGQVVCAAPSAEAPASVSEAPWFLAMRLKPGYQATKAEIAGKPSRWLPQLGMPVQASEDGARSFKA